jgi:hypothetical protein
MHPNNHDQKQEFVETFQAYWETYCSDIVPVAHLHFKLSGSIAHGYADAKGDMDVICFHQPPDISTQIDLQTSTVADLPEILDHMHNIRVSAMDCPHFPNEFLVKLSNAGQRDLCKELAKRMITTQESPFEFFESLKSGVRIRFNNKFFDLVFFLDYSKLNHAEISCLQNIPSECTKFQKKKLLEMASMCIDRANIEERKIKALKDLSGTIQDHEIVCKITRKLKWWRDGPLRNHCSEVLDPKQVETIVGKVSSFSLHLLAILMQNQKKELEEDLTLEDCLFLIMYPNHKPLKKKYPDVHYTMRVKIGQRYGVNLNYETKIRFGHICSIPENESKKWKEFQRAILENETFEWLFVKVIRDFIESYLNSL